MMVRHIRLDRRQFYLFEGLGINSLVELDIEAVYALPWERSDETIACRAALGERFLKGKARPLAKGG